LKLSPARFSWQLCGLLDEALDDAGVRQLLASWLHSAQQMDGGQVTSCISKDDFILCGNCQVCINHDVVSRLVTTPEVLLFWFDRSSGNATILVDVEEALMLLGLALFDWLL
jgi:hypothetical protein